MLVCNEAEVKSLEFTKSNSPMLSIISTQELQLVQHKINCLSPVATICSRPKKSSLKVTFSTGYGRSEISALSRLTERDVPPASTSCRL